MPALRSGSLDLTAPGDLLPGGKPAAPSRSPPTYPNERGYPGCSWEVVGGVEGSTVAPRSDPSARGRALSFVPGAAPLSLLLLPLLLISLFIKLQFVLHK